MADTLRVKDSRTRHDAEDSIKHVVICLVSRKKDDGRNQYLLIRSRKNFGKFSGCWYPPGGHLEVGEDERSALIRELREELDLLIEPVRKIAETPGDVRNQITHWWMCNLLSAEIKINEAEIAEVGWFTKEELQILKLFPATRSFFERYIFASSD